jgi:hypothetical protein
LVTWATGRVVSVAVTSGAGVSVTGAVVGVKAAAVKVNCETTVLAAEVRIAATSGVGSLGVADGPHAAISIAVKKSVVNSLSFIHPPDR